MNTRRSVMQLIGLAPAMASSARGEIEAALKNAPSIADSYAKNAAIGMVGSASTSPGMGKPSWLFDLARRFSRENEEKNMFRNLTGGIDPDIKAMRSLSDNYKRQKQLDRQREDYALVERLNQMMYEPNQ